MRHAVRADDARHHASDDACEQHHHGAAQSRQQSHAKHFRALRVGVADFAIPARAGSRTRGLCGSAELSVGFHRLPGFAQLCVPSYGFNVECTDGDLEQYRQCEQAM